METLRSLRIAANLSFEDLADAVSREVGEPVAWQTVQGWEHRGIKDASRILALASVYNTTPKAINDAASNSKSRPNYPRLPMGRPRISTSGKNIAQ